MFLLLFLASLVGVMNDDGERGVLCRLLFRKQVFGKKPLPLAQNEEGLFYGEPDVVEDRIAGDRLVVSTLRTAPHKLLLVDKAFLQGWSK